MIIDRIKDRDRKLYRQTRDLLYRSEYRHGLLCGQSGCLSCLRHGHADDFDRSVSADL